MLPVSALAFPDIDPVLIQMGPLAIRWYALAYIAGILLGWWYITRLNSSGFRQVLSKPALDDMVLYAILGILVGGRLGYVLFYKPEYYLGEAPLDIFKLWQGGMSFHGGLLGVLAAFWLFAKRHGVPYLAVMDLVACAAPIGLFFGRIANFINGELYGRVTDVQWAVIFPHGGPEPRHPSQLYEAGLEGMALFVLLYLLVKYTRARKRVGLLSGVFLLGYGSARLFVEQFREPDDHLGTLAMGLTMGQWLSLPMWILGIYLMMRSYSRFFKQV